MVGRGWLKVIGCGCDGNGVEWYRSGITFYSYGCEIVHEKTGKKVSYRCAGIFATQCNGAKLEAK